MWIPRVRYNLTEEWVGLHPMKLWQQPAKQEGGSEESASGVIASYVTRIDRMAMVTLRFEDSEYDAVMTMIEQVQQGRIFTFAFDVTRAPLYEYDVRCIDPKVGDEFDPTRDEYNEVWHQTMKIRTANGSRIVVPFYG
jgi:hypothetical protein